MSRCRLNACHWERTLNPAGLLPARICDELNSLPAPVLHGLVRTCSASALSYKLLHVLMAVRTKLPGVAGVQLVSQTHMVIYVALLHASHRSCTSVYNIVLLHTVDQFCCLVCYCRHC